MYCVGCKACGLHFCGLMKLRDIFSMAKWRLALDLLSEVAMNVLCVDVDTRLDVHIIFIEDIRPQI